MRRRISSRWRTAVLAGTGLVVLLAAGSAQAALPQQSGAVDLLSQANGQFDGATAGDTAGRSVAGAGDINGDEIDDLIVGAYLADNNSRIDSGSAYVVFGHQSGATLDLNSLGADGFRIDGGGAGGLTGIAVAGAGDVNDDGLDDVIVGASLDDNNARADSGSAYVVFGKTSTTTIDLASLGTRGFRLDGAGPGDQAGLAVSSAGDMNKDGYADVVVGAKQADNNARADSGSAYVVFGTPSTTTIDLASLGAGGFRIDGASAGEWAALSVAGAGDIDADGRSDVILGAPLADDNGRIDSGSAYVVFGKSTAAAIDLASLGAGGFRIDGAAGNLQTGLSVDGIGDIDSDGHADLAVGAPMADNNARTDSGSAYVVFGKSTATPIDLASLGAGGFRIDGAGPGDQAGHSVSGAGDANGDGRPDAIVGAWFADDNARNNSGSAYVVFGKTSTATVDLVSPGSSEFRIGGARGGDQEGGSVSAAGDVNGDQRPDVITGSITADNNGRPNSGAAHVTYGFGAPQLSYDPSSFSVNPKTSIGPLVPTIRRTGSAGFSVSPPLPAGLSLDPATGVVSGILMDAEPTTTHTVTMTDLAGTAAADLSFTAQHENGGGDPGGGPGNGDPCGRLTSSPKLSSVSRWTRVSRTGQLRLRGPVGGLALRSATKNVSFKLLTKGARSSATRIKQVAFRLDGKLVTLDKRAPFTAAVTPRLLKSGRHSLTATVKRSRAQRKLRLKIYAADCRPTRFSVAMSSKKRGARPSLKLLAQTYGAELSSARFALPRSLGVSAGAKARGKIVGTLRLKLRSGKRTSQPLRLPKRKTKTLALLSGSGTQVTLASASRQLSVSSLPPDVSEMSVKLIGKKTELLRNPRRCSRLRYRASLTDGAKTSLALSSGARICH